MNHAREDAALSCLGLRIRSLPAPLPQKLSRALKHRHAPVPVAVGDVDIAITRVNRDSGGIEKTLVAGIQRRALAGTVRSIERSPRSDLRQEFAVVRVLLQDAVGQRVS